MAGGVGVGGGRDLGKFWSGILPFSHVLVWASNSPAWEDPVGFRTVDTIRTVSSAHLYVHLSAQCTPPTTK